MSTDLPQLQSTAERFVDSAGSPTDLLPSDGVLMTFPDAGNITVNLPRLDDVRGRVFWIQYQPTGADDTILDPDGAETINGAASLSINEAGPGGAVIIYAPPTGTDWWILEAP